MCKLVDIRIDNRRIRVADIKRKYIPNIVISAKECDYIDKVVLFGSSISEDCTEDSDIDIAVFGNQPKAKCLRSKEFLRFASSLSEYDDLAQRYDILYFKTGKIDKSPIMREIDHGEVLYAR